MREEDSRNAVVAVGDFHASRGLVPSAPRWPTRELPSPRSTTASWSSWHVDCTAPSCLRSGRQLRLPRAGRKDTTMKTYKVPTLTPETPAADQTKLLSALQGVQGVRSAQLNPTKNEITITADLKQEPKRSDIDAAVAGVGFPLMARK